MIFTKLDPIDDAKAKMREFIRSKCLETESIGIEDAYGRILAEDVTSSENIPGFVRTAMDGYAVICSETQGASKDSPVSLRFIGEVFMGQAPDFRIGPGECAYVPTGGMMPAGADGIVIIEETSTGGDIPTPGTEEIRIDMYKASKPGDNLVAIDEDVSTGEVVLPAGRRLRAQEVGTLAALGRRQIKVYRQLTMSIISTGDELVSIDQIPVAPKVRDINSYTLLGIAGKYGMKVNEMVLLKDDEALLEETVLKAMKTSDIIAASGGSSVGKKDATARIFDKLSDPGIFVHGIALKPGKPTILCYDNASQTLMVGVPGHPSSAMMSFEMIVMDPIMELRTGQPAGGSDLTVSAVLTAPAKAKPSRDTCITVALDRSGSELKATPINKKSGAITMLSHADGYILLRAGEARAAGDKVTIKLF